MAVAAFASLILKVVLVAKLATWGDLGLAHAARPTAAIAARTANPLDRRRNLILGRLNFLAVPSVTSLTSVS
ncbi:MAG TPA: hypothetical protein VGG09_13460 [Acidimicrobiales bacterium]